MCGARGDAAGESGEEGVGDEMGHGAAVARLTVVRGY